MLTQPVPYFHLKLTLSDSRTIQFSRTCWAPCLHVAPFADFGFVHLSFICCSILCSTFSEFFVTPGFFRFYVYLTVFFRVDLEASQRKMFRHVNEFGGPFWCRTEANDTLTGPRRETQALHRHLIYRSMPAVCCA